MGDHKDNGINIDPAFVRALAELLDDTQLSEIEVEDGDRKVRVARTLTAAAPVAYAPAPVAAPAAATPAAPAAAPAAAAPAADNFADAVKSPSKLSRKSASGSASSWTWASITSRWSARPIRSPAGTATISCGGRAARIRCTEAPATTIYQEGAATIT